MKTMSLETLELTARTLNSTYVSVFTTEGNEITGSYAQDVIGQPYKLTWGDYKWTWKINGIPAEKSSLIFNLTRGLEEISFDMT